MPPQTKLRLEARENDILPSLSHNSLISVGKLADSGYVTLFMPGGDGVEVYDEQDIKFVITWKAVLRGWCDKDGLWRVPMQDGVLPGQSPSSIALGHEQLYVMSSTTFLIRHQLNRASDSSMHAVVSPQKLLGSKQSARATLLAGHWSLSRM